MEFSYNQYLKFKTFNGSYSKVTEREYFDSQITTTDAETKLIIKHFGIGEINVGNVSSNPTKSRKKFYLYPSGEEIFLNLVYPKPEKSELRLYISKQAGFKPDAGSIWFMFLHKDKLWIGSMPETQWRKENSGLLIDEFDSAYQSSITDNDVIKTINIKAKDIFIRDRILAISRMKKENYHCEVEKNHKLFNSRGTHFPYLESHHLVPISLQKTLKTNLDFLDNIFCLCPFCHSAIHHAESGYTRGIIDKLLNKRDTVLNKLKIDQTDLYKMYAVEDITKH